MSILKYRAFLTTVECKSLTRAAERLGYTQPGISHMIASLEKEFGFPLLVRTKDGAVPTENAQYLRAYMQQVDVGVLLQESGHNGGHPLGGGAEKAADTQ